MDDGRTDRSTRWDGNLADSDDPVVAAASLLVLGAGLGSLFGAPLLSAIDFWIVFVIGYAVVVPLVSLLRGRRGDATDPGRAARVGERVSARSEDSDVDAALSRLRERYARGDLSEAQFERKLEVLLETETPENARERLRREREAVERGDREREFERAP